MAWHPIPKCILNVCPSHYSGQEGGGRARRGGEANNDCFEMSENKTFAKGQRISEMAIEGGPSNHAVVPRWHRAPQLSSESPMSFGPLNLSIRQSWRSGVREEKRCKCVNGGWQRQPPPARTREQEGGREGGPRCCITTRIPGARLERLISLTQG